MSEFKDNKGRSIRLTDERLNHLETQHPEMVGQMDRVSDTLANPDSIVRSKTDASVELFYRHYRTTPVSQKFLCIVVKTSTADSFIITA